MTICGLDFETDYDSEKNIAWIVQFCLNVNGKEYCGTTLNQFKKFMQTKKIWQRENYIYVHNLAYDLQFFKYVLWDLLHDGTTSTIKCRFVNRQPVEIIFTYDGRTYRFRDSMKKIAGPLRNLGEIIGLPKLENNSEFYEGWSKDFDFYNFENWKYVKRDSEIVYKSMESMHHNQQSKATSSSDAFYHFQNMFNKGYFSRSNDPDKRTRFKRVYPDLSYETDQFLRGAYFGGINYSANKGKIIKSNKNKQIWHIDITSSYPDKMRNQYLPYGEPILLDHGEEIPKDTLYIKKFRAKIYLKKGCVPWFRFRTIKEQSIEGLSDEENVIDTDFYHEFTLSNVDIDNLKESYHIEVDPEYEETIYIFTKSIGNFNEYIDYWIKHKEESTGIKRQIAKNMLNQLYGRFALNPEGYDTTLCYDEDKDDLVFKHDSVRNAVDNYLPVAIFTTAYGRQQLIKKMNEIAKLNGVDSILHCDTDSVVFYGKYDKPSEKGLGGWKIESTPKAIITGGFKRYIEFFNYPPKKIEDVNLKCSGVSQRKDSKGIPYSSWVEILDNPLLISEKCEIGNKEYEIKSKWLRDIYINAGREPIVNTMMLKSKTVKGGVILSDSKLNLHDKWMVLK